MLLAQVSEVATEFSLFRDTVLGIVVILFILGWIWAKPSVDLLRKTLEKRDKELASLRQSLDEKIIPAIKQNTILAERATQLIETRRDLDRDIVETLSKVNSKLDRTER